MKKTAFEQQNPFETPSVGAKLSGVPPFKTLNEVFGGLSKLDSSVVGHLKLPRRPPGASRIPNRQNDV